MVYLPVDLVFFPVFNRLQTLREMVVEIVAILREREPQGSTSCLSELLNLKGFLSVNPLIPNLMKAFPRSC
jgi:hypothetical protein